MTNKGNITKEEQDQIKGLFKKDLLFKWTSPNKKDDVIFKIITLDLMKKVGDIVSSADKEDKGLPIQEINEKIFDTCVVWPTFTLEEKLALPVGTIPSIVKVIQEKSGFVDVDVFQRVLGPDQYSVMIGDYQYWADPVDEEIAALKDKTKFQLYKVRIGRFLFIIRPMTRTDLQVASTGTDESLTLVKSVSVWPEKIDWELLPAGYIEKLAEVANSISGWDSSATVEAID
jgi:hypothetical protein